MNNQECKTRSWIITINSYEPTFYLYSILVDKFSSSCNNINDPYAELSVYDFCKNHEYKRI